MGMAEKPSTHYKLDRASQVLIALQFALPRAVRPWRSVADVAEHFGISAPTVRAYVRKHKELVDKVLLAC